MAYDRRQIMLRAWKLRRTSYRSAGRYAFSAALRDAWSEAKHAVRMAEIEESQTPAQRNAAYALSMLENKTHWAPCDYLRADALRAELRTA